MNTTISIHEVTKIEAKTRHHSTSYGDFTATTLNIFTGDGKTNKKTEITLFSDNELTIEYPKS